MGTTKETGEVIRSPACWPHCNIMLDAVRGFRTTLSDHTIPFQDSRKVVAFHAAPILSRSFASMRSSVAQSYMEICERSWHRTDSNPEDMGVQSFECKIGDGGMDPSVSSAFILLVDTLNNKQNEQFRFHEVIGAGTMSNLEAVEGMLRHHLEVAHPEKVRDQVGALVTMDQIAAITHLSKRTVERMVKNGELPKRAIEGGRGKAHKWRWSLVRPALMELGFSGLPDRFPASRF